MFSFLGASRSSRRARSSSSARAALQNRRRRLCGWEPLEDRSLLAISVVSTPLDPNDLLGLGDGGSDSPAASSDGRYIVFSSYSDNLVSGDTNNSNDIFRKDTQTGTITRVSTDGTGNQSIGGSYQPSISADGRYVVFYSDAINLVAGDTNGYRDIFRKDMQTGAITLISSDSSGNQANSASDSAAISADGRYVVFESDASNLVSGDTNGRPDIFRKDTQTGTLIRVSTDSSLNQANAESYQPSISADGRYVAFFSYSTNLVSGDTNGAGDIFRKDMQTGATIRVNTSSSNVQADDYSEAPSISADGRYVSFESYATNLVSGDTNNARDIFRKDIQTGAIIRVNTDSSGNQANSLSSHNFISADGRYVVFYSQATNLVSGDTNNSNDVFLKDTQTGVLTRLSTDSSGVQGNNQSYDPLITADGRYVVFQSSASNLVSGDTNRNWDIYRKELSTGLTTIISVTGVPTQIATANSDSYVLSKQSVSADGRYVVFQSVAENLVASDTNNTWDVFRKDMQTGVIDRVSSDSSGLQGNSNSEKPSISADGRYVVFWSNATNLVSGDTNSRPDIFRKDMQTGAITRVNTDSSLNEANGNSYEPAISADGRYVVFYSQATNLVSGDTNVSNDIFRKDTLTGATIRVSTDSSDNQGNNQSYNPSISADGRYVVFQSSATNLVSGDTNGRFDIFRKDTQTGAIIRVSTDSSENQGDNNSEQPEISADGRYVVFYSNATNLVSGDTNGTYDVFRKDTQTGLLTRVSTDGSGNQGNSDSYNPSISADGRYVVFQSYANNLVSGDTNGTYDVFLKDTLSGVITRLSKDNSGNQANSNSESPSISADGRYVAFHSYANNLVSGDNNRTYDVFLAETLITVSPEVTSPTATNVTSNSATLGGNVTTDNGATITERGVLLAKTSTNANPQLNGLGVTKLVATGTTGVFTVDATGLDFTTGYSYVAFATNSNGTTYTTVGTFTTTAAPPTLDNPSAYNVGVISASFLGSLASTGGATVTNIGFVFAKTSDNAAPVIGGPNTTQRDFGTSNYSVGTFSIGSGNSLQPNTQYTFAAYATNSAGTTYSGYVTFTTGTSAPAVSNRGASLVTSSSARFEGEVLHDGGYTVTERGFLFAKTSENSNPQLNGTGVIKLTATGTTGIYSVNATGLDYTTGYSYVAYATNSLGTTYSPVATFTTLATTPFITNPSTSNLTYSQVSFGAILAATGGAPITAAGVVYAKTSENANPQIGGANVVMYSFSPQGYLGQFYIDQSGLTKLTGYSYALFATNSQGTTYTAVNTFTTKAGPPTLGMETLSNITYTSATVTIPILDDGGAPVIERGFYYYDATLNPIPNSFQQIVSPDLSDTYTFTNLTPGHEYKFYAYAKNESTTGDNGYLISFTTLAAAAPSVTSPTKTNITSNSATLGGNVTSENGATITERGVLLAKTSTNANPQLNGLGVTKITAAGTTGVFTVDAPGLDPVTGYSYVAFATNAAGTTYTTVDTFSTIGFAPTVTAPTATNVGLSTATLGGNVTSDGQVAITERGIVYSLTALNSNPQVGGTAVTAVTTTGTTGVFTINVSALPTGTQISYAAYAKNAVGTSYTTVGTFTTQPAIGQFPGITVQILGGQMIITGTTNDDTIKVAGDGSGGFVVTANLLINGQASPRTFTGATAITANTLAGHDDLWIATPLVLTGVNVDLGSGNDRFALGADPNNPINNNISHPQFGASGLLTINGPFQVLAGEGNDRVLERSTIISGPTTIDLGEGTNEYNIYFGRHNETNFTSGSGADSLSLGYFSLLEASSFDTGAGNDLISSFASRFYKTGTINSGAGADIVALDVNIYNEDLTVDTGTDADYLLFARSIADKSVSLTTGAGNDTVLIGKYITGYNAAGYPVYSNGGSRIDQLTLQTNEGADSLQMTANAIRLFYANLGDSVDDAIVESNSFTDGLLDGGLQGARFRLKYNGNLRTRNPG